MKKTLVAAAVGLFLGLVMQANAVQQQDYTFTATDGSGATASGLLDLIPNGGGSYTAISGDINIQGAAFDGSYSLILNPNGTGVSTSPKGLYYYDNQFFPTGSRYVDYWGLLFGGGVGNGTEINLYSNGNDPYDLYGDTGSGYRWNIGQMNITFAPSAARPVPDGGMTAMLLGMGMMGLGCLRTCFGKK